MSLPQRRAANCPDSFKTANRPKCDSAASSGIFFNLCHSYANIQIQRAHSLSIWEQIRAEAFCLRNFTLAHQHNIVSLLTAQQFSDVQDEI